MRGIPFPKCEDCEDLPADYALEFRDGTLYLSCKRCVMFAWPKACAGTHQAIKLYAVRGGGLHQVSYIAPAD